MNEVAKRNAEDDKREAFGWIFMIICIVMYPALFFICAFLPMWLGWAP